MNSAWEKFRESALVMARSGTVKERLHTAFRTQLVDLDVAELPFELRDEFVAFRRALTRERPMRGEDAVTATIRKLSSQEADRLAATLIEMFARMSMPGIGLEGALDPAESPERARVVPLFQAG